MPCSGYGRFCRAAGYAGKALIELERIGQAQGVQFRGVSHAGDGNLHLDVLRRGFTADEEAAKIEAFEDAACAAVYALGGKISGEHGIGQKRKALFAKYETRQPWPS